MFQGERALMDFLGNGISWNMSLLTSIVVKDVRPHTSLGEEDFLPKKPPVPVTVVLSLAYGLIIALAFIGNTLVIALLCKSFKLRAVTDLFLVWLAVGDMLVAGVNMPLQLFTILHPEWTLGEPACKFKEYFQSVTIIASILTLSVIALDRYFAICHPMAMRGVHTLRYATVIILLIWVTACLVSIPQILISVVDSARLVRNDQGRIYRLGSICTEYFPGAKMNRTLYNILTYVFYYILPVLVIVLAYGAVIRVLWSRKVFSDETQRQADLRTLQKQRLIKMLLALVVAFIVCWFPFFTATLVRSLNKQAMRFMTKTRLYYILQLIGYANTCVNPVIYTLMSPRMRRNFKDLCSNKPCCGCCKKGIRTINSHQSASPNTHENSFPLSHGGKIFPKGPSEELMDQTSQNGCQKCLSNFTRNQEAGDSSNNVNITLKPKIQTNVYIVGSNTRDMI